jgi:hypothetical protein
MAIELYYAPINEAATIPFDELLKELTAAGLPCKVELESEDMFWVLLDGHESSLLASVRDGHLVFATFGVSLKDDTTIVDKLDVVMLKAGYSAGDDRDLADDTS